MYLDAKFLDEEAALGCEVDFPVWVFCEVCVFFACTLFDMAFVGFFDRIFLTYSTLAFAFRAGDSMARGNESGGSWGGGRAPEYDLLGETEEDGDNDGGFESFAKDDEEDWDGEDVGHSSLQGLSRCCCWRPFHLGWGEVT